MGVGRSTIEDFLASGDIVVEEASVGLGSVAAHGESSGISRSSKRRSRLFRRRMGRAVTVVGSTSGVSPKSIRRPSLNSPTVFESVNEYEAANIDLFSA
jgi:hypothetical protein